MKAIILAAGLGTKLDRYALPKCLVNAGQKTILEREINILRECGIKDIIVIIGDKGGCWTIEAKNKINEIHDRILVNKDNINTTSAYSLHLALEEIEEDSVLVIDGDTLFEKTIINELVKNQHQNIMFSKYTNNPFGKFTRLILKNRFVVEIGEKENSNLIYAGLMKIGIELFKKLKTELADSKYWNSSLAIPLNKLCKSNEIYSLLFGEETVKENVLDTAPLLGGSHSQTKVINKIVEITKTLVRKEAYDEGKEKLIDEVKWLIDLPTDLKPYFPTVLDYNINSIPLYFDMPYYELTTLREILINGDIGGEKAVEILKDIMDFMFKKMYTKYQDKVESDYLTKIHINKTWKRFEETKQKSKILGKIIDCKHIFINGKKYINAPEIIKKIEKSYRLLDLLKPPFICKTHSDLHFDDILVDITKNPIKFILIDPRGLDHTYSYEYDLGKLFFSFDGLYDFMHEGLFDLEMKIEEDNAFFKYEIKEGSVLEEFKKISKEFPEILGKQPMLEKDKYWKERVKFTEAMLFLSNVPFQLRGDEIEKNPIAQYITGTRLINEFWDWWTKSEEFTKEDEEVLTEEEEKELKEKLKYYGYL